MGVKNFRSCIKNFRECPEFFLRRLRSGEKCECMVILTGLSFVVSLRFLNESKVGNNGNETVKVVVGVGVKM